MDVPHNGKLEDAENHPPQVEGIDNATTIKKAPIGSPHVLPSSPPVTAKIDVMEIDEPRSPTDNGPGKSDSEAETIVLPGKDGHSPSKIRKAIKHEDKSDDEDARSPLSRRLSINEGKAFLNGTKLSSNATSSLGKRKRQRSGDNHGNSSGLSSVPTSPVATTQSSLSKPTASDSGLSRSPSPITHSIVRDKAKSVDRVLQRKKRYDPDSGEDDDVEERRSSRKRHSDTKHDILSRKDIRSSSPPLRGHQRSISTQLPARSSSGLSHKKKRVPPPLQSTEYHSDTSSASASSFPRSARLRGNAALHTGDSNMSPVKTASHKKHVNSSGQTQLQRACAGNRADQLSQVTQRYDERPQDLNESDHAGNTPLHSAAINGSVKIVKFLLGTGHCIVDPLNIQKDTPLHDSLENGHVDVVKLLLNAGADPRKPKGDGKDPMDIINEKAEEDDDDPDTVAEWAEMKRLIQAAIKKQPAVRQDSEDERQEHGERGVSHATDSPRHTPPVHGNEFSAIQGGTRRVGVSTSRQVKTRDGNLYQPMNLTELRKAARDGDNDTTARILEVMPNVSDPMTLWLSARGGHSDTMEFQLAMGKFDPDTSPISGEEPGKNTPFLVAIGRGNHLNVLKLLLSHGVDPTRLHGDGRQTYFDLARERKGPNWQEEVSLLKEAYDTYKKNHKSSPSKPRSPGLRRDQRDADGDRRPLRRDDSGRAHKVSNSESRGKDSSIKSTHRRNSSNAEQSKDMQNIKRGPGRPRKESVTHVDVSDQDSSPVVQQKSKLQSRKSESELNLTSDNEVAAKPRRKLVSGKEYRGERVPEKQRRASMVSNNSNLSTKDKRDRSESKPEKFDNRASPSLSRLPPKSSDREYPIEKQVADKDRARSLKRDESKDRLSAIRGESPAKRPRTSETPPRSTINDSSSNAPKRRKIDEDVSSRADSTPGSSPEIRHRPKPSISRDGSTAQGQDDFEKNPRKSINEQKSDSTDDPTPSVAPAKSSSKQAQVERKDTDSAAKDSTKPVNVNKEDAPLRTIEEGGIPKVSVVLDESAKIELARKKQEDEQREAAQAEAVRQALLAKEQKAKDEEARRLQEEADRKEREQQEENEARLRAAEAQKVLYLEQERQKKEEAEKRKIAAQEQARAEKIKQEKVKREEYLAKLPYLLRWHELTEDIKTPTTSSLFKSIPGYRCDTIRPEVTGQPHGKEQWMLNTHVAILLGERDLKLSRYTGWERIPLNLAMKKAIWSTQNDWYTLRNFSLPRELREYFPTKGLSPFAIVEQNKALFLDLDLFFVKVPEFLFVVPNFPHLRNIEIEVKYMELVLPTERSAIRTLAKWKSDSDVNPSQQFAPRSRYYLNGDFSRIGQLGQTRILTKPPHGDDRVPRRGLVRAYPGDPDYEKICRQQGLLQFLPHEQISPVSSIGAQITGGETHPPLLNGSTPPDSDFSRSLNGGSPAIATMVDVTATTPEVLTNGVFNHVEDHEEAKVDDNDNVML